MSILIAVGIFAACFGAPLFRLPMYKGMKYKLLILSFGALLGTFFTIVVFVMSGGEHAGHRWDLVLISVLLLIYLLLLGVDRQLRSIREDLGM